MERALGIGDACAAGCISARTGCNRRHSPGYAPTAPATPVLGYADDAIIVAAVLRWAVRQAGIEAIRHQWPGTGDGFTALCRIAGLASPDTPSPAGQPSNWRGRKP
jgi:hypothetical protein